MSVCVRYKYTSLADLSDAQVKACMRNGSAYMTEVASDFGGITVVHLASTHIMSMNSLCACAGSFDQFGSLSRRPTRRQM